MHEFEIIERYFKNLSSDGPCVVCGIGDDAAVIEIPDGYELVASVDTLVCDVHFTADVDPHTLGHKVLAVNLSDLAAMGAEPGWATLSLTMPENNTPWIEKFAIGFSELANHYRVSLVGGDLSRGPLSITVQAMGIIETGTSIRRSGAQVNDDVYVSGYPGEAGFGLMALEGVIQIELSDAGHCMERLQKPQPRIDLGRKIRGIAHAAIDISDGLAADLGHILNDSSVGAVIELNHIPLREPLAGFGDRDRIREVVLSSGDDYELCFTVSGCQRREMEEISASMDFPVTRIGRIVDTEGLHFMLANGSEYYLKCQGYRHF